MIVFDLRCKKGHQFEAWFKDSATFELQRKARAVSCPTCGVRSVEKAPMAPNIAPSRGHKRTKDEGQGAQSKKATYYQMVKELHRQVAEKCDYVGERFSEEARRMHSGEAEKRGIYGEATLKDAIELQEEGIDCNPLPELPHTDA
jgi:hypothetical protein